VASAISVAKTATWMIHPGRIVMLPPKHLAKNRVQTDLVAARLRKGVGAGGKSTGSEMPGLNALAAAPF
jgi:hypothetical protein